MVNKPALYSVLFTAWAYGDPHIRTLDGFAYTFNGLGEYWLVTTENSTFELQGRTARAQNAQGQPGNDATIWSAATAKSYQSATFEVEVDEAKTGRSNRRSKRRLNKRLN